jgi:hypothetical protein
MEMSGSICTSELILDEVVRTRLDERDERNFKVRLMCLYTFLTVDAL